MDAYVLTQGGVKILVKGEHRPLLVITSLVPTHVTKVAKRTAGQIREMWFYLSKIREMGGPELVKNVRLFCALSINRRRCLLEMLRRSGVNINLRTRHVSVKNNEVHYEFIDDYYWSFTRSHIMPMLNKLGLSMPLFNQRSTESVERALGTKDALGCLSGLVRSGEYTSNRHSRFWGFKLIKGVIGDIKVMQRIELTRPQAVSTRFLNAEPGLLFDMYRGVGRDTPLFQCAKSWLTGDKYRAMKRRLVLIANERGVRSDSEVIELFRRLCEERQIDFKTQIGFIVKCYQHGLCVEPD